MSQHIKQIGIIAKKSNILFFAIALVIFATMMNLWDSQTTSYAYAYTGDFAKESREVSSLLKEDNNLFDNSIVIAQAPVMAEQAVVGKEAPVLSNEKHIDNVTETKLVSLFESQANFVDGQIKDGDQLGILNLNAKKQQSVQNKKFAEKLYEIVGDTPIKDMVPFISERDRKVAAFLVGIAKKESSFGLASPLKDGETCYNYWGYKGAGGRGTGMGYACFASAEEAIKVVGDRIEVLVNKERNTPARMVDTWKCGTSCVGDPGAPGWVSTVALYFEKIVS